MARKMMLTPPYWKVNPGLQLEKRDIAQRKRLASQINGDLLLKGHVRDLGGPVWESPIWNQIITNTGTGIVNVLLSIGGNVLEISNIFQLLFAIHKELPDDEKVIKSWGGFLDNTTGKPVPNRMIMHITFMAGASKIRDDDPQKAFVFESNKNLDALDDFSQVRVIGTLDKVTGDVFYPS